MIGGLRRFEKESDGMIRLLSKIFIKNRDDIGNPAVRTAYGILCGAVGILLNLLLFAGKFFAGTVSGSIAITADAFNNLSDAGSSVITLMGFRLGEQKPDSEHPFGHGRIEYLSGLLVSMGSAKKRVLHRGGEKRLCLRADPHRKRLQSHLCGYNREDPDGERRDLPHAGGIDTDSERLPERL